MKKNKSLDRIRMTLMLQVIVFIYSLTGTISKYASLSMQKYGVFSIQFIGLVFAMVCSLGIYAIFWQRALKIVELSVAYANKGIGILWTLVWSVLLFKETITVNNIVGIIFICIGVIVVTGNE